MLIYCRTRYGHYRALFFALAFLQRHGSDLSHHQPSFGTEAENERDIIRLTNGTQRKRNRGRDKLET